MRIWFLSNGRGEDHAAAAIAGRVGARARGVDLQGVPFVGAGEAYARARIPVAVRGANPASGGFSTLGAATFVRDLPALPAYPRMLLALRRLGRSSDRVIVVGDVFALLMARAGLGRSDVFVSLAKSSAHVPHTALEIRLMRRVGGLVLSRDEQTAAVLGRAGVPARHLGNPLMDDLHARDPLPPGPPTVGLLPGSRREGAENLGVLLDVIERARDSQRWACALAAGLRREDIISAAERRGWTSSGDVLSNAGRRVELYWDRFCDVVHASVLVLGMAGTANEQAAGLGRPVVTCAGRGPQASKGRLRAQERLLRGAARFVDGPPSAVAAEVERLLADHEERGRRAALGPAVMGPPGASARIADLIVERVGEAAA